MALVFVLRKSCCWVIKLCLTFCDPMDCSMPGFPVLHYLPEFAQIHIHWVSDAIQLYHPLLSPSSRTLNLSQHQGLFQWVGSSHEVAKVLALQPQHQTFQWTFRVDILLVWLIWSPCCPRDSGESSPAPQFSSTNSWVLSLLYGPTLTSVHDNWKTCAFCLCMRGYTVSRFSLFPVALTLQWDVPLQYAGFSLRWLPLLQNIDCRASRLSSCDPQALEHRFSSCLGQV